MTNADNAAGQPAGSPGYGEQNHPGYGQQEGWSQQPGGWQQQGQQPQQPAYPQQLVYPPQQGQGVSGIRAAERLRVPGPRSATLRKLPRSAHGHGAE